MAENARAQQLRKQILESVAQYHDEVYGEKPPYVPGDRVPTGGRYFDSHEMTNLVSASLDFWLTAGPYAREFEHRLAQLLGKKYCLLVNSGSSANLLAFMVLTSPQLGERAIKRGDEVITVAAGFPTTITPIIQYGAVPVFIDITKPGYNVDGSELEQALSPRTKAVMLAHTLGNPFDIVTVKAFCEKHNLWLVEDNCDSLGSRYHYNGKQHYTGTIGDIGTSSFYPAHHITMGEGGSVYTDNDLLYRIILSLRDWGRDCWCQPGSDNTCKNRFSGQFGLLPRGYDHKYVYSHFGYNMKITDLQASIGCAQIDKLESFTTQRIDNWQALRSGLDDLGEYFVLPEPLPQSSPSWFGFVLSVRDSAPFTCRQLVAALEAANVQTRALFAGNILKHPCFDSIRSPQSTAYRCASELAVTEWIMDHTFWVGVCPVVSTAHMDYVSDTIHSFVKNQ